MVLNNEASLSRKDRVGRVWSRKRKVNKSRTLGRYHPEWQGKRPWIEIRVDKTLAAYPSALLWLPPGRYLCLGACFITNSATMFTTSFVRNTRKRRMSPTTGGIGSWRISSARNIGMQYGPLSCVERFGDLSRRSSFGLSDDRRFSSETIAVVIALTFSTRRPLVARSSQLLRKRVPRPQHPRTAMPCESDARIILNRLRRRQQYQHRPRPHFFARLPDQLNSNAEFLM